MDILSSSKAQNNENQALLIVTRQKYSETHPSLFFAVHHNENNKNSFGIRGGKLSWNKRLGRHWFEIKSI